MESRVELFLKATDLAFEKNEKQKQLNQIVFILSGQINPKPKKKPVTHLSEIYVFLSVLVLTYFP